VASEDPFHVPQVVGLAVDGDHGPGPTDAALVQVVLREIIAHDDAAGCVNRMEVAAASAILGRARGEDHAVVVTPHRLAVFGQCYSLGVNIFELELRKEDARRQK